MQREKCCWFTRVHADQGTREGVNQQENFFRKGLAAQRMILLFFRNAYDGKIYKPCRAIMRLNVNLYGSKVP